MYLLSVIVQCTTLVLLLTQPIFGEIIRFNDGAITYEYDNSCSPLGRGAFGTVYEGTRTEGNCTESVAFKELQRNHPVDLLLNERNMCEVLSQHDSFPNFYHYLPETNKTGAVFAMERIGRTLKELWDDFRPFSPITAIQVGLQLLDAVEWMHCNGFTHSDLHIGNVAVGHRNKSKIYLFDFGLARMDKNHTLDDLLDLSKILNTMISSNTQHKTLKQFESIIQQRSDYGNDKAFKKETFDKLRSILTIGLKSHKNDANYEKCDIGYIQDNADGMNLLRILIRQNKTSAIENLIQSERLNINVGFGDTPHYKPIHLAVETGNASMVQHLIDNGARINSDDTHDELSPLHYAAMKGDVDMVRVLIKYGADIDARSLGSTPLHWAAWDGYDSVVRVLIENGAEVNANNPHYQLSPIHFAAMKGDPEVLRVLSERSAGFNDNSLGSTSLHYAALNGHTDIVRILIDHGADINAKRIDGTTPLHYAATKGRVDVVRVLCEHGADINAKTLGFTPLNYATLKGHIEVVKILEEAEQKRAETME